MNNRSTVKPFNYLVDKYSPPGSAPNTFSYVPSELGYRPLTADGTFRFEELPCDRRHGIGPMGWDPSLYALLGLPEFIIGADWKSIVDEINPEYLRWQGDSRAASAFVSAEISKLAKLMDDERTIYMNEILAQADGAMGYWLMLLGLDALKPWTTRVLSLAARIGEIVAMYAKAKFNRPRPSQVCPALMPPFGPPAHPSFPSSHATEGWLTTLCLIEITRSNDDASPYEDQLNWLAARVGHNRERAGFHYPSDTAAGKEIAERCFKALLPLIEVDKSRLQEIFTNAKQEWATARQTSAQRGNRGGKKRQR